MSILRGDIYKPKLEISFTWNPWGDSVHYPQKTLFETPLSEIGIDRERRLREVVNTNKRWFMLFIMGLKDSKLYSGYCIGPGDDKAPDLFNILSKSGVGINKIKISLLNEGSGVNMLLTGDDYFGCILKLRII